MTKIDEETEKLTVEGDIKSSSKWDNVLGILGMLPAIIWWLICVSVASFGIVGLLGLYMPFWFATALGVILGVVVGTVFAAIAAATIAGGASTVVELNVSCCILLILTGILFPVFGKARDKARQTTCASNLKSISVSMLMYAQDNDDALPVTNDWMDTLSPYNKTSAESEKPDGRYHCPSASGKSAYGYAYNRNVASCATAKIADPRAKMLVYDSAAQTRSASDPGTSLPKAGRHSDGNNIAFADGHVRWIKNGDKRAISSEDSPSITP